MDRVCHEGGIVWYLGGNGWYLPWVCFFVVYDLNNIPDIPGWTPLWKFWYVQRSLTTRQYFYKYTDATYGAWQYSHLIEGKIIITPDDGGESYTVNAGDSFIIEKGFAGTWKMEENVKLHFYIKLE
jgi:hypothetical protein